MFETLIHAGIRADAKAAKVVKDTGQNPPGYNPQGLGAAWSHNFLNQKPWHPANFRNQAKVYEAEQNAIRDQKAKAQAKVGTGCIRYRHQHLQTV